FRHDDRPADRSQRGAIVEADNRPIRLDTKLRPEGGEAHTHWLFFHFRVKGLKDTHAEGVISRLEVPVRAADRAIRPGRKSLASSARNHRKMPAPCPPIFCPHQKSARSERR